MHYNEMTPKQQHLKIFKAAFELYFWPAFLLLWLCRKTFSLFKSHQHDHKIPGDRS